MTLTASKVDSWQLARDWVGQEHALVTETSSDQDDERTLNNPGEWRRLIDGHLQKATQKGLGDPLARQAVAKAAALGMAYLESVLRIYKSVPNPGAPLGENTGEFGRRSS